MNLMELKLTFCADVVLAADLMKIEDSFEHLIILVNSVEFCLFSLFSIFQII